jgi:hypothetical protein
VFWGGTTCITQSVALQQQYSEHVIPIKFLHSCAVPSVAARESGAALLQRTMGAAPSSICFLATRPARPALPTQNPWQTGMAACATVATRLHLARHLRTAHCSAYPVTQAPLQLLATYHARHAQFSQPLSCLGLPQAFTVGQRQLPVCLVLALLPRKHARMAGILKANVLGLPKQMLPTQTATAS